MDPPPLPSFFFDMICLVVLCTISGLPLRKLGEFNVFNFRNVYVQNHYWLIKSYKYSVIVNT